MNSIARVLNAIHCKLTTPIPKGELVLDHTFVINFLSWQNSNMRAKILSESRSELIIQICRSLKLDLVCIQSGETGTHESSHTMNLNDIEPIARNGLFVFWVVDGAFQKTMEWMGMITLLTDIARSPKNIGHQLKHLSDQVIAKMIQGVDAGAHGIIIADDIAYKQSTYMSPDFVERYLVPIWQNQVSTARALGVPVFFHSDGNLNAVLSHIVAAGFDGLQCIEPAAGMDLPAIKRNYGNALCLMGNIDPSLLSHQNSQRDAKSQDDRLAQSVTDLVASADADGGLIFGTCSGLHAGMSPERVDFMYRLAADLECSL